MTDWWLRPGQEDSTQRAARLDAEWRDYLAGRTGQQDSARADTLTPGQRDSIDDVQVETSSNAASSPPGGTHQNGARAPLKPSVRATDEVALDKQNVAPTLSAQSADLQMRDRAASARVLRKQKQLVGVRLSVDAPNAAPIDVRGSAEPASEYLTVGHLLALKTCWSLGTSEVARLLHVTGKKALKLERSPHYTRLSLRISRRLSKLRVLSKRKALKLVAKFEAGDREPLDYAIHREAHYRKVKMVVVKGELYRNEAICFGLWPGELAYYRYVPKGSVRLKSTPTWQIKKACIVVHVPTNIAAKCEDFNKFEVNRLHAESRLMQVLSRSLRLTQENGRRFENLLKKVR